nr:TlpA disulfide reductase family protein [Candidatus Methylobacter favarea]
MLPVQAIFAVEAGGKAPDCGLTSMRDAQRIELRQFSGKVLYVDFWASWCGPCVKSFPFLNSLHEKFSKEGLQILGVNLDENPADAREFLGKYPADFTVAADANEQCARDFDVKAMPSSYLIDRQGVVRHIRLGFRPGEAKELQSLVERLLAEDAGAR